MNNRIIIEHVSVSLHRIEVYYTVQGEIEKYFNLNEKCFWVEYTEDISSVPEGIAVIPFVCNVLPIAWLADAELVINELDEQFYQSLFEVKHGYMLLSRMLEFKGKVTVGHLVNHTYEPSKQSAVFFSGGVDAFTTLFRHLDENPIMITLRGADVKLTDDEGWKVVSNHVLDTAQIFQLPQPLFVTTNFRTFIHEGILNEIVVQTGDGWWHGYQHGIGIIGHAAPLAYTKQLKLVYIASSYTWEFPVIVASDPVIDSHLQLAQTSVRHDGYFMGRMAKEEYIVKTRNRLDKSVNLRVCWISTGGQNCCECEKCIRTIFGIVASGGNPVRFGFHLTHEKEKNFKEIVLKELSKNVHLRPFWREMQTYIKLHDTFSEIDNPNYNWIYTIDVDHPLPKPSLFKRGVRKIRRILKS